MRNLLAMLGLGVAMAFAAPNTADAQTKQDGLVNVRIGDITVKDINIAAAVNLVATACDLVDATVIANVLSAATLVDARNRDYTVCRTQAGKVQISQN